VYPDKYDRDEGGVLSEPEKRELVARIADAVGSGPNATPSVSGGDVQPPQNAAALELRLAELQATLERIGRDVKSLGVVGQQSAALRADIERLAEALAEREEREPHAESMSAYNDDELLEHDEWDKEAEWVPQPRMRAERPRPISAEEARERLITLRRGIWEETGSGPSADGLLRKSMIDAFLQYRPVSHAELRNGPMKDLVSSAPVAQQHYLPEVLAILQRLKD
jgi:hypothetical protein